MTRGAANTSAPDPRSARRWSLPVTIWCLRVIQAGYKGVTALRAAEAKEALLFPVAHAIPSQHHPSVGAEDGVTLDVGTGVTPLSRPPPWA
jgi:hypothetical protein